MRYLVLLFTFIALVCAASDVNAQKRRPAAGRVCGDPTVKCKTAATFEPWDLPFDVGRNFTIGASEYFYGIVLKSKKLSDWGDCEKPTFKEAERLSIQGLFPNNKVFAQNCVDAGTLYYSPTADKTALIGVYAGRTLAEANAFLKVVKATGKFPGVTVRRMRASFNGT